MNSMLEQWFSTEFDLFNEEMTPRDISSVKLSVFYLLKIILFKGFLTFNIRYLFI